MSESCIELVGGNIAGAKAAMLIEHEPIINEAGLVVPPTVIAASEMLEPLMKATSEGIEDTEVDLSVSNNLLQYIHGRLAEHRLIAVRSSALGDARGNGTYRSLFATNTPDFAGQAMVEVLRSFHSTDAKEYRRKAGLGDHFAVMFQPIIGQILESDRNGQLFAPPLSGFGYSQTRFIDDEMINVVAGLGGGVDRAGGELVSAASLSDAIQLSPIYADYDYRGPGPKRMNFWDYMVIQREAQRDLLVEEICNDWRNPKHLGREEALRQVTGLVLRPDEDSAIHRPEQTFLHFGENGLQTERLGKYYMGFWSTETDNAMATALKLFEPGRLLEKLVKMEKLAGYPLYIEWALGTHNNSMKEYILQIAPLENSLYGRIETEIHGKPIVIGRNVIGHGVHHSDKIVYCTGPNDLRLLAEFNADPQNDGYILIYPADLTTSKHDERLHFSDMSNAGVIIETKSSIHGSNSMTDHIVGLYNTTGKLFAEFDHKALSLTHLNELLQTGDRINDTRTSRGGRIIVRKGNFTVIADQTQNKLIIGG